MTFLSLELICFITLAYTTNAVLFQLLIFIIISCCGGAFATIPAFIKDMFGADNVRNGSRLYFNRLGCSRNCGTYFNNSKPQRCNLFNFFRNYYFCLGCRTSSETQNGFKTSHFLISMTTILN